MRARPAIGAVRIQGGSEAGTVIERVGDAIRFNTDLLPFAATYRYEPRPVAVARGNQKGRD